MYAYEGAFTDEKIAHWLCWTIASYDEKGFGLWAIERKSDHKIIGECGITEQKVNHQVYVEIGYHLVADGWKKGYMTEVAQAVRDYGFHTLHMDELVSIIRETNIPSMNMAIRNGMTIKERIIKQYQGIDMPHFIFHIRKCD